jgi:hypothetical protein
MPEATYNPTDLAIVQLDEAIRQFLDKQSYICAITLSGAAEELLGRMVQRAGGESALAQLAAGHLRVANAFGERGLTRKQSIQRHNFARDSLKHLTVSSGECVTLDLEDEVIDLLDRAIYNVILLGIPFTNELRRFNDWYVENCVGGHD